MGLERRAAHCFRSSKASNGLPTSAWRQFSGKAKLFDSELAEASITT